MFWLGIGTKRRREGYFQETEQCEDTKVVNQRKTHNNAIVDKTLFKLSFHNRKLKIEQSKPTKHRGGDDRMWR